jgi:hypothetical protein
LPDLFAKFQTGTRVLFGSTVDQLSFRSRHIGGRLPDILLFISLLFFFGIFVEFNRRNNSSAHGHANWKSCVDKFIFFV